MSRFQATMVSDRQTDGHTDRQGWIYSTLPAKAMGPKNT